MNIIVTGGAGFIGSHVADAFVEDDHNVITIDNLSSGKIENVHDIIRFIDLSIGDPEVEDIFRTFQIDVLCHHAAQMDVRESVANPIFDANINIIDAIRLLQYCVKFGVKKVIFSSTGGVIYGDPEYLPVDENHPVNPLCPYGISKLSFEHYIHYFKELYGLDYTILRYGNVYGPRQDPHGEAGVIAIFSGILLEGKRPTIFGDGEQTRDYIYVSDVVRANLMALEGGSGEIMNVGTGEGTSVNRLLREMCDILELDIKPKYAPARPGEIQRIALDASKIEKVLGWKPEVSLQDGFRKTIEFFKKKLGAVAV